MREGMAMPVEAPCEANAGTALDEPMACLAGPQEWNESKEISPPDIEHIADRFRRVLNEVAGVSQLTVPLCNLSLFLAGVHATLHLHVHHRYQSRFLQV